MDSNARSTLIRFVEQLGVHIRKETAVKILESHPDFPSLYSISSVLSLWNIDNAAFRIKSLELLYDVPTPFIAYNKAGEFIIVSEIRGDRVVYWDSQIGIIKESISDFYAQFDGVVLIAETTSKSGEDLNAENSTLDFLNSARPFIIYALLAVVTAILFLHAFDISISNNWILYVSKFLGLSVSLMLLLKQIGSKSSFLEKVCHIKSNTNCDNLLNRPEAKIFGWLSWSEVGVIYFAGGVFALSIDINNILIIWLSIFAVCYTIYSIYFQAFVAKIWCPLCLVIQGILFFECFFSISLNKGWPTAENFISLILCFSLPVILILSIKPLTESAHEFEENAKKLRYFFGKVSVFKTILQEQPILGKIPENISSLIIGDFGATNTLTMITNPYCRQCKDRHMEIENLLKISKNINVRIIFFTTGAEDDKVTTLVQHLLALDFAIFPVALKDWFSQNTYDYKKWARKYPAERNLVSFRPLALDHGLFCWREGLTSSPILFINNRRLPDVYEPKDLAWLLSESINYSDESIQSSSI